jgi:hypothetical protein
VCNATGFMTYIHMHWYTFTKPTHCNDAALLPLGLEPRTFRLLAECSNQLSYESGKMKNGENKRGGVVTHTPSRENSGAGGYRSRYLSHAKRALYHLSYGPLKECSPMFSRIRGRMFGPAPSSQGMGTQQTSITHRGARTHDHQVKSLTLYRLS